jgi:hypothetical protein
MSTRRLNRVTGRQGEIIIFIKTLIKSFKACVVEVILPARTFILMRMAKFNLLQGRLKNRH